MENGTLEREKIIYNMFTPMHRELMVRAIEGAHSETKKYIAENHFDDTSMRKKDIFSRLWGFNAQKAIKSLCDRKLLPMKFEPIKTKHNSYEHYSFVGDTFDLRVNLTSKPTSISRRARERKQAPNCLELILNDESFKSFTEQNERIIVELNFGGDNVLEYIILGIPDYENRCWQNEQSINCLVERNENIINNRHSLEENIEFDGEDFNDDSKEGKESIKL